MRNLINKRACDDMVSLRLCVVVGLSISFLGRKFQVWLAASRETFSHDVTFVFASIV